MMKRARTGSESEDDLHRKTAKKLKKEKRRSKRESETTDREKNKRLKKEEAATENTAPSRTDKEATSSDATPTDATPTGRQYTVSIALPGSIISNAQTPELKTYLAGQIARAAAVFNVDEIVVFDESGNTGKALPAPGQHQRDPNVFLARILQYLETPQYLRKALFPMHPDLKLVGLLNPLDCPHHMRIDEEFEYREGVTLAEPVTGGRKSGSMVNCGLRKSVLVDKHVKQGVRVTVRLKKTKKGHPMGEVVTPSAPRATSGTYWGYSVRFAHSLGAIFTESPFEGGYDLTLGTSERGDNIDNFTSIPSFRHLLVVFGGVKGLEYSLECDESLHITDVSLLFHHYLNTCPNQGSRTIRTEEAIPITMTALRPLILRAGIQRA